MIPAVLRFLSVILSIGSAISLMAGESYRVETIPFPPDMPPEVGAIDFDSRGTLYVALRRGDIITAQPQEDPASFQWHHFASGFHNPCGIHIVAPGHIIVSQMAELTEVVDQDQDGVADDYRALSTDFGLSGNYHETMDICPDGEGGLYLAPGTASHNGPTFATPRGAYSKAGRLGRNFSAVEWRGWVLHWNREKGTTPISSGYRMHNGIERAPDGTVWCGDNQGDWRASSPIYQVTEDSFAGHPSSLIWDPRFSDIPNPLLLPRILLDDLWNKPAIRLPRDMMNSCAEPAFDTTGGQFGPFDGQMFIPDQSGDRIVRIMREKIDGAWQGAARIFLSGGDLLRGNNRLAFSPSGDTLYTGQTGRGWGKLSEGLQRIRYTGKKPFEVVDCNLTHHGFRIRLTGSYRHEGKVSIERFRYRYGYTYGGPEEEKREVEVISQEVDPDDPTVLDLELAGDELVPDHLYRIRLDGIISAEDSSSELGGTLVYTLNRLLRPEADHQTTIKKISDRYRIDIDDNPFTEYRVEGFSNPILYPILSPSGTGMTRDWPIAEEGRQGEEQDHPHHKSLFIGHQRVNGIDFWHEGGKCGVIEHARTIETRSGEDRALIRTFNLWKDSTGETICSDTRTLEFGISKGASFIDLELNLHASHGDVTFGAYKDGLIGLRTHPDLRLRNAPKKRVEEVYGHAENSTGETGKEVWGKRANWIHYHGRIDDRPAGIAILSHPRNPRSPAWWHARDYGLLAVNPFGPEKDGGDGEFLLTAGQTLTLRYRFLFHDQSGKDADIAGQYADYIDRPLVPRSLTTPIPVDRGKPEKSVVPANVIARGEVLSKVNRTVNGKKAANPKIWTHGFIEGAPIFGDRDYLFTKVPDYLRGGDLIETFNDDKKSSQSAAYEITISEPGMLYLLVDKRVEGKLTWLVGSEMAPVFERTQDVVSTNTNFEYLVYVAEVDPGTYLLGDQTDGSFYSIVGINRD